MTKTDCKAMTTDIYNFVFQWLDEDTGIEAVTASRVAMAIEDAAMAILLKEFDAA